MPERPFSLGNCFGSYRFMLRKIRTDWNGCRGRLAPPSDLARRSDPGTLVCARGISQGGVDGPERLRVAEPCLPFDPSAGNAMGTERMSSYGSGGIALLIVLVAFAVYDVLWKNMKNETTGMIVSLALFAVLVFIFHLFMGGRAVFVYAGGLFGTIMAANVWMRIWPNQRKIIAGVKGTGPAADPSIPALAALRSKHNTYMSVPLIFFMVSNHFPGVYGNDHAWVLAIVFVILGWGITKFLFNKAATPAPAQF